MKKASFYSVLTVLTLCFTLFSCNKNENTSDKLSQEDIQLSYSFQGDDSEIIDGLDLMSKDEALVVNRADQKFMWNVMPKKRESDISAPSKAIVCSGSGISFVNDCKSYLDKGDCLKIYRLDDGFAAELTTCPKS